MINFKLCRKCPHGDYRPQIMDGERALSLPLCLCGLVGEPLVMKDDPPKECPYGMEHAMTMQCVSQEFAEQLSDGRKTWD